MELQLRSEEFAENITNCRERLISRLIKRGVSVVNAEDILQHATLKMWKNYDKFEQGTCFEGWAWAFTKNIFLNFLRSKQRSVVNYDREEPIENLYNTLPSQEQEEDYRVEYLREVIRELSSKEVEMLKSIYTDGDSLKVYAEKHNLCQRTCFNKLSLLRKKIRLRLNDKIRTQEI